MLEGCEFGSKRRARGEPFFRSLGNDGDCGGVVGGRGLLGGDARFALGRGERRLDLVDAGRRAEDQGRRSPSLAARSRAWRPARRGSEFRRARRRRRFLVRNLRRQALSSLGGGGDALRVLRVCRFERAHALVEFSGAGRRDASLQRAHALVEACGCSALALGFRVERGVLALSLRSRAQRADSRPPRDRPSKPRNRRRRPRRARKRSSRRARRPRKRERQFGPAWRRRARIERAGFRWSCRLACRLGRARRRPLFVSAARGDFAFDDAGVRPSVAIDRGASASGRNVLSFLVDHRLAPSIFRGPIYGRSRGKETR